MNELQQAYIPAPACAEVVFTERAARPVLCAEQENSYCASGFVFLGTLTLMAHGAPMVLPAQTGGWMCSDSPFVRGGLCPSDASCGAYDPLLYPDTAFPSLPAATTLGTLRTGKRCGFRIPDPPGIGRSALMVHAASRYGSEGCISIPPCVEWARFCDVLAGLHEAGIERIPLRVIYTCPPPDAQRAPGV